MGNISEYLIREDKLHVYTVSKWEGSTQPSSIYKISMFKNIWTCECHGYNRHSHCRHIDLIKKWLKMGQPAQYIQLEE